MNRDEATNSDGHDKRLFYPFLYRLTNFMECHKSLNTAHENPRTWNMTISDPWHAPQSISEWIFVHVSSVVWFLSRSIKRQFRISSNDNFTVTLCFATETRGNPPPFRCLETSMGYLPASTCFLCNSQMSEPMDTDSEPQSPKSQAFLAMRAFLTNLKHSFRNVPLYVGTDLPTWIFRHARAIQPWSISLSCAFGGSLSVLRLSWRFG